MMDTRRKVAFFYLNLDSGGVQHMMVRLAEELARRGSGVDFVLLSRTGEYVRRAEQVGRVIELSSASRFFAIFRLAKYLRRERPDVLFAAVPHMNIVAILAKFIARSPVRVVVSERSDTALEFKHASRWRYKASFLLIPAVYRLADVIVAVSRGTAASLSRFARMHLDRINVVYNPVFDHSIASKAAEPVDHPFFNQRTEPIVITVGRLVEQKNHRLLLEAFQDVLQQRSARLIVVGKGPLEASLRAIALELGIIESVSYVGFQANPYAWMAKADLFVLSSSWEGFGNVIVEALACGIPVVSTDCPSGPSEILSSTAVGLLVAPGDKRALAQGILESLDRTWHKEELLRHAQQFSIGHVADAYCNVFWAGSPHDAAAV